MHGLIDVRPYRRYTCEYNTDDSTLHGGCHVNDHSYVDGSSWRPIVILLTSPAWRHQRDQRTTSINCHIPSMVGLVHGEALKREDRMDT